MSKKGGRVLNTVGWILMAAGAAAWFYYLLLTAYAGFGVSFGWFWALSGTAGILAGVLCRLCRNGRTAFLRPVLPAAGLVLCTLLALFLVLEGFILKTGFRKPEPGADYLIVLGAQVRGRRITKSLQYRLDAAQAYLRENENTAVVCSGGQGAGEEISEASAMKEYLVENGIPEKRILTEDKSTNTLENIRYSLALIGEEGKRLVIVTNRFHVLRGMGIAKKQEAGETEGLGAPCDGILSVHYYVREAFALVKDFLAGNL